MASSSRKGPFADLTNRESGPASATRSKKSSVPATERSACSIFGSQESRVDSGNANANIQKQQNDLRRVPCAKADGASGYIATVSKSSLKKTPRSLSTPKLRGSREFYRNEIDTVASVCNERLHVVDISSPPTNSELQLAPEDTRATPAKQISPTFDEGFRTPENLLSGVGDARLTNSEIKVYERRKSYLDSDFPRTCPQLGRVRSTEKKRPQFSDWQFIHLRGAQKNSRSRTSGTSKASSSRSETEKSYDSASEKAYLEGRAYFAEVDAFELLEEEEEVDEKEKEE